MRISKGALLLSSLSQIFAVVLCFRPPGNAISHRPRSSSFCGTSTTTTTRLDEFRIVSKPPSRVVRDPKTGFYRPVRKQVEERPQSKEGPSAWDSFKAKLYGSLDGATALPDKIKRVATLRAAEEDPTSLIVDGYRQVQQRVYASGGSPAKRFLEEYEERFFASEANEEGQVKPNLFQSFKGAFYGTVDAANRVVPASALMEGDKLDYETFKPVVKSSFASSQEVQDSLRDLQSDNPVRKAIARYRINEWDRKEKNLATEIDRYRKARQVKEVVYSVGDAVQNSAIVLSEVPGQVSTLVEQIAGFLASLPAVFQKFFDSISAIPTKVEQQASQVQQSVEQTVQATQKVVQDVQALPAKVQQTAQTTQQVAVKTIEAVDYTVNRGRVLLGLVKPVPRPPNKPPPKDLTWKEVGWNVASGVATGASKVAWWAAKGAAILTWKGATLAVEKGIEAFKEEQASSETLTAPPSSSKPPATLAPPPKPSSTVAPVKASSAPVASKMAPLASTMVNPKGGTVETKKADLGVERVDDLDRQVEEALRLAEEALRMAEKQEETSST